MRLLSFLPPIIFSKFTLLDLPQFNKFSHISNDLIVAHKSGIDNSKCVFFIPGLDMSGLSIYPSIMRVSDIDTYTLISKDENHTNLEEVCSSVSNFIKDLNYDEFFFVGESCGAIVCINSIKNIQKDKIKKIVLINSATAFWGLDDDKYGNFTVAPSSVLKNSPRVIDIYESIICMNEDFPNMKIENSLSYFYMLFNQLFIPHIFKEYRILEWIKKAKDTTINAIKDEIDCEILLVCSKKDGLVPQEGVEFMFSDKNITLHEISDGTHLLTPNLFDIRDFI